MDQTHPFYRLSFWLNEGIQREELPELILSYLHDERDVFLKKATTTATPDLEIFALWAVETENVDALKVISDFIDLGFKNGLLIRKAVWKQHKEIAEFLFPQIPIDLLKDHNLKLYYGVLLNEWYDLWEYIQSTATLDQEIYNEIANISFYENDNKVFEMVLPKLKTYIFHGKNILITGMVSAYNDPKHHMVDLMLANDNIDNFDKWEQQGSKENSLFYFLDHSSSFLYRKDRKRFQHYLQKLTETVFLNYHPSGALDWALNKINYGLWELSILLPFVDLNDNIVLYSGILNQIRNKHNVSTLFMKDLLAWQLPKFSAQQQDEILCQILKNNMEDCFELVEAYLRKDLKKTIQQLILSKHPKTLEMIERCVGAETIKKMFWEQSLNGRNLLLDEILTNPSEQKIFNYLFDTLSWDQKNDVLDYFCDVSKFDLIRYLFDQYQNDKLGWNRTLNKLLLQPNTPIDLLTDIFNLSKDTLSYRKNILSNAVSSENIAFVMLVLTLYETDTIPEEEFMEACCLNNPDIALLLFPKVNKDFVDQFFSNLEPSNKKNKAQKMFSYVVSVTEKNMIVNELSSEGVLEDKPTNALRKM